jgi:hypothetical protein
LTQTASFTAIVPLTIIDDIPDSYVLSALLMGIVLLFAAVIIIRARLSRDLDQQRGQLRYLQEKLQGQSKSAGESIELALKRLLELGVLQPKEYMEKSILAQRLGRKVSVKKLLEEGLISKEQYDTLTRKDGEAA